VEAATLRGCGGAFADGFVRAIVDPGMNAVHRALLRGRRTVAPAIRAARDDLVRRALAGGPESLDVTERRILLGDPACVDAAHHAVWELPADAASRWGIAAATQAIAPEALRAPMRSQP
jgi:membrane glycosyltransferase